MWFSGLSGKEDIAQKPDDDKHENKDNKNKRGIAFLYRLYGRGGLDLGHRPISLWLRLSGLGLIVHTG